MVLGVSYRKGTLSILKVASQVIFTLLKRIECANRLSPLLFVKGTTTRLADAETSPLVHCGPTLTRAQVTIRRLLGRDFRHYRRGHTLTYPIPALFGRGGVQNVLLVAATTTPARDSGRAYVSLPCRAQVVKRLLGAVRAARFRHEPAFGRLGPWHGRVLAGRAESGLEEGLESCDATRGDADADLDGCPDGKVSGTVEEFAFVGFEGAGVRKADDGCSGAAMTSISIQVDTKNDAKLTLLPSQ